jgi:hypothetical protein
MFRVSKRCYCAFCRSERNVYLKRHVSVVDIFLSALTAALVSLILWQSFDPRAVVFFALGLGLAEVFIMIRWRMSISCPHCGFDPVLYKRKPEMAAAKVRKFLDQRREDPLSAFSPPPKLPNVVKKKPAKTLSREA